MIVAGLKAHRRLELSDHFAGRVGLPTNCVACNAPLFGDVRARMGLWNDRDGANQFGAICDACYLKVGGKL